MKDACTVWTDYDCLPVIFKFLALTEVVSGQTVAIPVDIKPFSGCST